MAFSCKADGTVTSHGEEDLGQFDDEDVRTEALRQHRRRSGRIAPIAVDHNFSQTVAGVPRKYKHKMSYD